MIIGLPAICLLLFGFQSNSQTLDIARIEIRYRFFITGQVTLQGFIKDEQGIAIRDANIMIVKNGGELVFNFTMFGAIRIR